MPANEAVIGDESITLNWNIENFSSCVIRKCIKSPVFSVRKVKQSDWQLELYPLGIDGNGYMEFFVSRYTGGAIGERNRFTLSLSVIVGDEIKAEQQHTVVFEDAENWPCEELIRRDLLPNPLPNDSLSFRCKIQPKHDVSKIGDGVTSKVVDYKNLMQDLSSLLKETQYHDLVLIAEDTRFKVHKCVMEVRWPMLPRVLNRGQDVNYSNCGSELVVPNTPSDVLKTMLIYAYSGTILAEDATRALFKSSVQLEFIALRWNLTSCPKAHWGKTVLNTERRTVIWHLDNIDAWNQTRSSFIRILPVTELYVREIILLFTFWDVENGDKNIDISFRIRRIIPDYPIFLKCKIDLMENGTPFDFELGENVFRNNDTWRFPYTFTKRNIPDMYRQWIKMEIAMADDGVTNSVDKTETDFFSKFTPIHDLSMLSFNMSRARPNNDYEWPGFLDFRFNCKHNREIGAHRAILWARWPELRCYLESPELKSTLDGKLKDVDLDDLERILHYVYTGKPKKTTIETIIAAQVLKRTVPLPKYLEKLLQGVVN